MKTTKATLKNGIVYHGVSSEGEWDQRLNDCYEEESAIFTTLKAPEVDCFLDIGSFCGYFGLLACNQGTKSIFVEPNETCCELIEKSLDENDFEGEVINKAISNKTGTQMFSYGRIAGFYRGKKDKKNKEVPVTTISNILRPIEGCGSCMLKIDIEGMEREAIEGIQPYQQRIKYCIVEFHPMFLEEEDIDKCFFYLEDLFGWERIWSGGNPYKDNINIHYKND